MDVDETFVNYPSAALDSRWLVRLPDCCDHHVLEVEVLEWSPAFDYVKLFRVADAEEVWYPAGDVVICAQLGEYPDGD